MEISAQGNMVGLALAHLASQEPVTILGQDYLVMEVLVSHRKAKVYAPDDPHGRGYAGEPEHATVRLTRSY